MRIPFQRMDIARDPEVADALRRVHESGRFVLGPEVEAFETEFAAALGVRHAVGVASGTDAITLALAALGIGPGGRVLTTAFSAGYTALGVLRAGAAPVFADVEPSTLCLDPAAAERVLTRELDRESRRRRSGAPGEGRLAALLPVHLYGHPPAGWERLLELAAAHDLPVVEDACQAHGARYRGRSLGSFGRAAAFSFYPTKNLGGLGDGGAVATDDPDLAAAVRSLRQGGEDADRRHLRPGWNSRLDEIQAAVLRVRLRTLEARNERRRALADRYRARLSGLPVRLVEPDPAAPSHTESARHLLVVRAARRDALRRHLAAAGVGALVHYPETLPSQPAFRPTGDSPERFPEAERAAAEVLSLPLYPLLREAEVDEIAETIAAFDPSAPGAVAE